MDPNIVQLRKAVTYLGHVISPASCT